MWQYNDLNRSADSHSRSIRRRPPGKSRAARYGFKAAASVLGSRSPVAMPVPAAGGAVGGSAPGKRLQFDKKEDISLPLLSLP